MVTVLRRLINVLKPQKVVKANVYSLQAGECLKGKRVVITGGTGGIGRAMAKRFIEEGAKVLITGRNPKTLNQVSLDLGCEALVLDVTQIDTFDEFTTLYDRFVLEEKENFKLSALFFFNVGTHGGGGEKARKKFLARYNYLLPLTQEIGLPFVPMDSNLFDFYKFEWEYDAGVLCRAFGILAFEKVLKKYYIAYDYSFWEIVHMTCADYASITDMTNYHHLGTENLEIIVDGTQYRRSEKTEKLLEYPPFMKYVNVCVGSTSSANNCSLCHKCMRTQLTLDILHRLEDFNEVFILDRFRKKDLNTNVKLLFNARQTFMLLIIVSWPRE